MKRLLPIISLLFFVSHISAQNFSKNINPLISAVIKDKDLKLGFAVKDLYSDQIFGINMDEKFPMQSVYKFPISLAALSLVDNGLIDLSDSLYIDKSKLHENTYSPLRNKYPDGVKLPLSEIIDYTITLSDNNTSDILFELTGKGDKIKKFLNHYRIWQVNVVNSEQELHADNNLQFDNWATPWGMIQLLTSFESGEMLAVKTTRFLRETMKSTKTGSIKNKLPDNIPVAHKTGYSGYNESGICAAVNDIGIMYLPSGHRIAFAIFITDSKETKEENYKIISEIGEVIYNYYK